MVSTKDVPPGGVGEIKATFKSKGYQGDVTKSISIETNDPSNRVVRLTLKGKVVPDVSVEPRHVNFGKVNRNEPPQPVRLEITLREGRKLKIKEVTAAGSASPLAPAADRTGAESAAPAGNPVVLKKLEETERGAVYTVGLGERSPTGRIQGVVLIKTNSRQSPEIQVPYYGTVEGNVRATPQFLSFAAVPPGEKVTREITLTKTGRSDFTVTGITASSEKIQTELRPVREGEEVKVAVTYLAPPDAQGRISEKLRIAVKNSGEEELLDVPVYGTVYRKKTPPQ